MILQIVSTLVELIRLGRKSESEKDLEILLLCRPLAIFERKQSQPMRLSRGEKLALVVLGTKLRAKTGRTIHQMGDVIRIVKPATLFGWHKQLVRLKWTYRQRHRGGRPCTDREIEQLVLHLARENGWGNGRIEGELLKLGYDISDETVGNILLRRGVPPVPEPDTSPSWRHLMTHYKDQLLACDFFTVETLFLRTIYVLMFIEIGSRRVHFAGCTAHPDNAWITQQARQMMWELEDRKTQPFGFSSGITTRNSVKPLTPFFARKALTGSRPPIGLRMRTRIRSVGFDPCAKSAWTNCSSSTRRICDASCANMLRFSIQPVRIRASRNRSQSCRQPQIPAVRSAAETCWEASFTITTATLRRRKSGHLRGFLGYGTIRGV
jgi:putative transposase